MQSMIIGFIAFAVGFVVGVFVFAAINEEELLEKEDRNKKR